MTKYWFKYTTLQALDKRRQHMTCARVFRRKTTSIFSRRALAITVFFPATGGARIPIWCFATLFAHTRQTEVFHVSTGRSSIDEYSMSRKSIRAASGQGDGHVVHRRIRRLRCVRHDERPREGSFPTENEEGEFKQRAHARAFNR